MPTPLCDVYKLAGSLDMQLVTPELHPSNDFYGFAALLKRYAGVLPEYQIKAVIEHGPTMGFGIWDVDVKSKLPAILPMSCYRVQFLKKKTAQAIIPIGPMITYAEHYLSNEELQKEKKRIGKNLLAFPAHSTHHVDSEYDVHAHSRFLEKIGRDFDTITICLSWKDVLLGKAELYRQHGFECVTAGHMFDPLFMSRLKSIIELATLTTSFELTSAFGYSVLMGKPHYYHEFDTTWRAESHDIIHRDTLGGKTAKPLFQWVLNLFSELRDDITPKQREAVYHYFGFYDTKTPEEVRAVFEITEDMYRQPEKYFFLTPAGKIAGQLRDWCSPFRKKRKQHTKEACPQEIACRTSTYSGERPKDIMISMKGYVGGRGNIATDHNVVPAVRPDTKNSLRSSPAVCCMPWDIQGETQREKTWKAGLQRTLLEPMLSPDIFAKPKTNRLLHSDIPIASYPRSGNTWMRLLLTDIILQYHGFQTDTKMPIHQDNVIPELPTADKLDPRINLPFRLIKSHDQYDPITKKAVYIFRLPQDSLCSDYHFHRRYPQLQAQLEQDINVFCLKRVNEWLEHIASYVQAKLSGACDVLFVSYERLHGDTVGVLMKTAAFLGLTVSEKMCRKAVENHLFKKHRATETLGSEYREFFFRKGKVGSGKDELRRDVFLIIEHKAKPYYEKAVLLECADSQPAGATGSAERNIVLSQMQKGKSGMSTYVPWHENQHRLLNLGCGSRYHPAWVNVDFRSNGNGVIVHDLKKRLPFDDVSFDAVYHSHVLEHFPKHHAPLFLRECFRVLRPGGILRVVVPDLEQIVRLYLEALEKSLQGNHEAQYRYEWIMLELFDQMVRNVSGGDMFQYWRQNPMPAEAFVIARMGSEVKNVLHDLRSRQSSSSNPRPPEAPREPEAIGRFRLSGEVHQWMYDRYSLGKLLCEAGFEDVRVCRADESAIPDFNTYRLDIESDGSVRKPDSLFMEGRKPAAVTVREERTT